MFMTFLHFYLHQRNFNNLSLPVHTSKMLQQVWL